MKLKTSKSAFKRFKITGSGKILIGGMSAQHRAKGKSKRTKSRAGKSFELSDANRKTTNKLIPYR